ncbi:MAG: DUF2878 domain-containing protein [Desulfofustis sp.]|nr:DUF2878 domain-containing protein [Desulfofustis sp.]
MSGAFMLPTTLSKIINVVLYQVGWFSCVLGAALGYPVSGAVGALSLLAIHLLLADERKAEIQLMLCACLLGVVVDSLQQASGVFTFKNDSGWPFWLPLWIPVIWAQFATLFRYALFWLSGRYLLAAFFGSVGGPLAYWGGVRLGAAQFGENMLISLITLALVWALVTPLLFWISSRLGHREGRYRSFAAQQGKP